MPRYSICVRLLGIAGLVGVIAAVPDVRSSSAQKLNDMVRTLNHIVNPDDARRLEDQARRSGQSEEERYWRDYRAGLDARYRDRGDYRDEGFQGDSRSRSYREPRDVPYDRGYPSSRDYPYGR